MIYQKKKKQQDIVCMSNKQKEHNVNKTKEYHT